MTTKDPQEKAVRARNDVVADPGVGPEDRGAVTGGGGTPFTKAPLVAADLLNDRVIPFFDEHGIPLSRVLTDRGTEYCGAAERHEYKLYLVVENVDHTRTKVKSQQLAG